MQRVPCELDGVEPLGHELLHLGEEDELVQPIDEQQRSIVRNELDLVPGGPATLTRRDESASAPRPSSKIPASLVDSS